MPSVTSQVLHALAACSLAADREKTSPTVGGVYMHLHPQDGITVCATDGKLLAEHKIMTIDAYSGGIADFTDPLTAIVADGPTLARRLKPLIPGKWAKPFALTLELVGKSLTLTGPTASLTLALIQGVYPDYRRAMDVAAPPECGINADYLGRLEALLGCKVTTVRKGRGWLFEPLDMSSPIQRRALIMPVSVPGGGTATKTEQGPGAETADNADLHRQIADLEAKIAKLSVDLKGSEDMREDLLAENRSLMASVNALADRKPQTSTTIVRWHPAAQGRQLKAAGLTVADLRAAGFRWVPADQSWESLDPEAQALIDRILAAQ